jgi:hypothetical protein
VRRLPSTPLLFRGLVRRSPRLTFPLLLSIS